MIQPSHNAARGLPNRSDEEFKCSQVVVRSLGTDSPSSGNGSTRQPLGSFIKLGDEEKDPFINDDEPSEQQNVQNDEEDCNLDVTEEQGPSQAFTE